MDGNTLTQCLMLEDSANQANLGEFTERVKAKEFDGQNVLQDILSEVTMKSLPQSKI